MVYLSPCKVNVALMCKNLYLKISCKEGHCDLILILNFNLSLHNGNTSPALFMSGMTKCCIKYMQTNQPLHLHV